MAGASMAFLVGRCSHSGVLLALWGLGRMLRGLRRWNAVPHRRECSPPQEPWHQWFGCNSRNLNATRERRGLARNFNATRERRVWADSPAHKPIGAS